jgi:2,5-dihydroxypyridine 5,6-dioxygenase
MKKAAELTALFRKEFDLCRVVPGEIAALLTTESTRPEYVAAATGALQILGAQVFEITVPEVAPDAPSPAMGLGGDNPMLSHPSPFVDAVGKAITTASFVVDLVPETIIHGPLRQVLRDAGCRVLTIVEPPDVLERMFPTDEIRSVVQFIGGKIAEAKCLVVRSEAGTDLTYQLDARTPGMQYGYTDVPGKWDHWPSALVTAFPLEGATEGTVVVSPGDVLLPLKRYADAEVRFRVENGVVTAIDGGFDAELIRDFLSSWQEPEAYAVSHTGIGLHPRARWSALAFYEHSEILGMDARCVEGGFIFSTGPNRYVGRLVEAHIDCALRHCTVVVDDETVVDAGRVLAHDHASTNRDGVASATGSS